MDRPLILVAVLLVVALLGVLLSANVDTSLAETVDRRPGGPSARKLVLVLGFVVAAAAATLLLVELVRLRG
jgi:hypothetical protein